MQQFPTKWRDTVDPFSLPYKNFKLTAVLGYPHAGNDVFFAQGIYKEKQVDVIIKVNRQRGADVKNEILTLQSLNFPFTPEIIDYDDDMTFRVSIALEGEKLSTILGENKNLESMQYMAKYGEMLATIHSVKGDFLPVKDRRFFHIPNGEVLKQEGFEKVYNYLCENKPKENDVCFCHGDFHYANLLWKNKDISAILDFELSGMGIREFDIAWALILRPGQAFLRTQAEIDEFLNGYSKRASFNYDKIKYYMAQIYLYFYFSNEKNESYTTFIKNWYEKNL